MTGSRSSNDHNNEQKLNAIGGDGAEDSEDECEILEESPCGRWAKRREEVSHQGFIVISFLPLLTT